MRHENILVISEYVRLLAEKVMFCSGFKLDANFEIIVPQAL